MTSGTQLLRSAGTGAILLTAGLAAYAILEADDKVTETARQGTVIEGGLLGGYLAGFATASPYGPGAPLCALAVAIAGTATGSLAAEYVLDKYQVEIQELRKWGVH